MKFPRRHLPGQKDITSWQSVRVGSETFALELTRAGANTGCGADDSIGMVDEFSAVVAEYHKAEEQAKGQSRYDKEVDGHDVVTVSSQEGSPGRRRVTGGAAHVLATVRAATS